MLGAHLFPRRAKQFLDVARREAVALLLRFIYWFALHCSKTVMNSVEVKIHSND